MSSAAPTTRMLQENPLYGAIHIPDFEVQALLRHTPHLRRQSVAVLDGTFPLLTVIATNVCARQLGIRTGMTRLQLEQFRDLQIRYRSKEQEDSTHHALLDTACHFTPRVEDTAPDTIALDLTGLSGLWGTPRAIAQKLLRAAARVGVEIHIATASSPDSAIHAARSKAAITIIHPGEEFLKLGPLPLSILNLPEAVHDTVHRWGIHTFRDLATLPTSQISERLGQEGVHFQKLARGAVHRPLRPVTEPPCFAESMELDEPVESVEPLAFILSRLLNQLCRRLTSRNLATNELRLTLGIDPGARSLPRARSSKHFERRIQLPVPVREAKTLLKLLQLDLDTHRPPAPVSTVSLVAEPVTQQTIQEHLFRPRTPEPEKLELTLTRIGNIIGKQNIGTPDLLDSHRPNAFRIQPFRIVQPTTENHTMQLRSKTMSSPTPAALRISRPAQPVTVETEQGQPARMLFAGKTGTILACAGPWNTSGDWWRSDAWNREEWDVEVQTEWRRTLYRIFRDPRKNCWFIDGTYD